MVVNLFELNAFLTSELGEILLWLAFAVKRGICPNCLMSSNIKDFCKNAKYNKELNAMNFIKI